MSCQVIVICQRRLAAPVAQAGYAGVEAAIGSMGSQ